MKFSRNCILLFTLSCLKSAYALPVVERDEPHVNPIAHVPGSATSRIAVGITPNVHILNKADLLTEGTVVPGFLGPEPNITATPPQKRDIIGPDNRYLQTKTGNPWNYIGSFAWQVGSDGYRCSGALVGPRHLATARHCYNTTNNAITYNFRPNYDQGTRGFTTAQVTNVMFVPGTLTDTCSYGDDWVIMILNQRVGDQYGYFGVRNYDASKANQGFFHEGYPIDLGNAERPYMQDSISTGLATQCNNGGTGPVLTSTDAAPGQSGGPLWLLPEADGVRYLYGVLSGGSSTSTFFAGRNAFVNAVAQARKNYP